MAVSEAQSRANKKYKEEKCDVISVLVPKGKKPAYQRMAKELGTSLPKLIQYGVEEFVQNHATGLPQEILDAQRSTRERLLLERFNGLPERAKKNFLRLMDDLTEKCRAKPQAELKFKEMTEIKKALLARFNLLPERAQRDLLRLTRYLAEKCGTELETDEQEGD